MGQAQISQLVFQPPPFRNYAYVLDRGLTNNRNIEIEQLRVLTSSGNFIQACYIDLGYPITILHSHGNAEDMNNTVPWLAYDICRKLKVNAMSYDYEGYGGSEGVCSEEALFRDIEACYKYLTETKHLLSHQILLHGVSLGTAPTTYLASLEHVRVRGVILQSPLCSVFRVALRTRYSMPGDFLCSIDRISKIKCPVLVIHGMIDEVIPFWNGEEMYRNCTNPVEPVWVSNGSHNDLISILQDEYYSRLIEFIDVETFAVDAITFK